VRRGRSLTYSFRPAGGAIWSTPTTNASSRAGGVKHLGGKACLGHHLQPTQGFTIAHTPRRSVPGIVAVVMVTGVVGAVGIAMPQTASADGPSTVTQTFAYTGSTTTFTVPADTTQVSVTMTGGKGGRGGTDSAGPSPAGGYQGLVAGTMTVTPGQVLTIGVGSGGATGAGSTAGQNSPTNFEVGAATGGSNPLGGYGGGNGGVAGYDGSSGNGGAGGAASVITTGSTTIVAGGSGGAGGSGQFAPTIGHVPYSTFSARSDTTSGSGRKGITVYTPCQGTPGARCDGGGGGAGGGGVQGGEQGSVQFGSGSSNEWYGYGGYPGQNSTGSVSGLTGSYQYYPDNSGNGSVTIAYTTGAPGAPTSVGGVAGDTSVALTWTAPGDVGQSAITDYVVQYAPASSPTSWTTFSDDVSTATSATVSGLDNGTGYVFQVIPVNAVGNGTSSASSGTITPNGPPAAPSVSAITARDGGLSVAFTDGASGSTILDYEYRLDGTGPWTSTGSTLSPLDLTGLTNGTQYAVQIRAVSAIGSGAASSSVDATPQASPGAPTITAVSTGAGSAAVSFIAGYSGGGTITDYEYELSPGIWTSAGTTTSPLSIPSLANGTAYTVAIRAMTSSGAGAASQTSGFTTPEVPSAPGVSVTRGDTTLAIAYTPGSPGGSTITGYEYSLDGGSHWTTATTASPIVVTGLTNGTTYPVSVRAVNTIGNGAGSTPQDATPATVPGAPGIVGNTVAGSDSQLSAAFTGPGSDGGSAITDYEYSTDAGATWRVRDDSGATSTPLVISTLSSDGTTPLVNGTTYSVELRAVNAVGSGLASDLATGIAGSAPSPPTVTAVTAGSGSLQVGFTPGANGGAQINGYEYQLNSSGSWISTGTLGNTFTITGLTNGSPYAVQIRATNSVGTGTASESMSGTPRTAPAQPTITTVIRGDHSLSVAVADADDGGSSISTWQYSTDGGTTWRSAGTATSPLAVSTLSTDGTTQIANGTSYPLAVRALNAAGASVASATTSVGPSATPSTPTVALTAQNQAIRVAFTVPGDGGSPVSAIEYSFDNDTWVNAGTLSSPFTIASLTNGTSYTVRVRARNAMGPGTSSTPSSATPLTTPDAPGSVAAVANTASADVTWTAPGDNGGSAITSYTATAYTDDSGMATAGTPCVTATTACSITGLTNGTMYAVSVVATNATGSGIASSPRVQVTPLARPGAPTLSSLTPGDAFLTLGYSPGSAGSSAITGYQYQLNGGTWQTASSTTSPLTISGVTNGTSYTVALRAVSDAGVGTASGTLSATPFTYPDAPSPVSIVATGQNGSILVSWAAPASNGSAITGYTAAAFTAATAGTQARTCSTSGALTCTLSGLSNGTTYYVSLQALNAAGLSARSAPRIASTPFSLPGAVTAVTGVRGDGQVNLSWTAGSSGTGAITDYTLWYSSGGGYTQFADGTSAATTATVTGLTNGTAYTFQVYAVNAYGTGPVSPASSAVTPAAPGTVPTASAPVRTAAGYAFDITNYSTSYSYGVAATSGSASVDSSGHVTVTGLTAGSSSTTTVTATRFGFTTTSVSVSEAALNAGTTVTFSPAVSTAAGFTFDIAGYSSSVAYDLQASSGSASADSGGHVTVTGLAAGTSSTITVTASRIGYTTMSASIPGSALDAGTVPIASTPVRTDDGYTFAITNYSGSVAYDVASTNGASAVLDGSGHVTVTGLADGTSSTTTVTATRAGYTTTSASASGTALSAGTVPIASTPVRTADGYTFDIENHSTSVTYAVGTTSGSVSVDPSGHVAVTALEAGTSSTTTVTASRAGYSTTTASTSASALEAGTTPLFWPPVQTDDGYTFELTNYSPSVAYTFASTNGASAVIDVFGQVTVTGLAPGAASTTTMTATRTGYTTTSVSVPGSALNTGATPTFSLPARVADGYTFDITNYSPSVTYDLVAGRGSATAGPTGHVTVAGLASGTSSTTTVTASRAGYTTTSASTSGQAISIMFSPGDFTGDQKADVVAIEPNGDLSLYRGNGRGGFTGARSTVGIGWGSFTKVLSPGDFTGDHKADILAIRPNGDLVLYRGDGLGGFIRHPDPWTRIGSGWAGFTKVFSPGDFTGDHKADIIAIKPNGDLYLYRGDGRGGFIGARSRFGIGWGSFTKVLSPGDLTGDNKADLLAVKPNGDLALYRGNGLGGFIRHPDTGTRIGIRWGIFTNVFSPADFTGDHKADILAVKPNGDLYLYRGNGIGGFIGIGTKIIPGWHTFGAGG
jgi:predicted RNA-binding protein with TRAM domain